MFLYTAFFCKKLMISTSFTHLLDFRQKREAVQNTYDLQIRNVDLAASLRNNQKDRSAEISFFII